MTCTMHAGWCDGGPLAGQQLAHDGPRYRMAKLTAPPPDPDEMSPRMWRETNPPVIDGEYVWDDGAWRWRGFA